MGKTYRTQLLFALQKTSRRRFCFAKALAYSAILCFMVAMACPTRWRSGNPSIMKRMKCIYSSLVKSTRNCTICCHHWNYRVPTWTKISDRHHTIEWNQALNMFQNLGMAFKKENLYSLNPSEAFKRNPVKSPASSQTSHPPPTQSTREGVPCFRSQRAWGRRAIGLGYRPCSWMWGNASRMPFSLMIHV